MRNGPLLAKVGSSNIFPQMTEGLGVEESEVGFLVMDVVEVIKIDASGSKRSAEAVIEVDKQQIDLLLAQSELEEA